MTCYRKPTHEVKAHQWKGTLTSAIQAINEFYLSCHGVVVNFDETFEFKHLGRVYVVRKDEWIVLDPVYDYTLRVMDDSEFHDKYTDEVL